VAEVVPGQSTVGALTVYAFPASQLGVFAQQSAIGGQGQFDPLGPDEIIASSGAVAALDGTQFDNCPGQNLPSDNSAYETSACGYPDFLVYDVAAGIRASSLRPSDGITICVANNQAVALPGAQLAFGTTVAMQLWPALVSGGAVVADNSGSNSTQEWRAALAIMSPTQVAFIVGVGDMVSFATAIAALGATDAGYTDGGGSAALVTPAGMTAGSSYRPVPTWLIAKQPETVTGIGIALGALVAALVAGGIAYEVLKIRKPEVAP
jgi:hypothetical protein